MAITGEIRMIQYGVIPSEPYFAISVGQGVGGKENLEVAAIEREWIEDRFEYHIVCKQKRIPTEDDDSKFGREFIWKTYYKQPDWVQFFLPDQKHDYVKI